LDALQEQLRHLATQPGFISQFLHEGAYVFPVEAEQISESTPAVTDKPAPQTVSETPVQPIATEITSNQRQTPVVNTELPKSEPATATASSQSLEAAKPDQASVSPTWQNKVVVLLPPEPSIKEVQFLHKILAASGVSDDQVFLQEKVHQARGLALFTGSRLVLSFGAVNDFKADYQLRSKTITVIMADKLSVVEADLEAKKKLWAAMKSFFK